MEVKCAKCKGRMVLVLSLILATLLIITVTQFSRYIANLQSATIRAEAYRKPLNQDPPSDFDKVIHHIWNDNSSIPDKWVESSSSCIEKGHGYVYHLWTHSQIRELIRTEYPWLHKMYLGYKYDIQRVDVSKYVLLYHYGGIYTDLDIVCKYPWDDLLANYTHFGVIMAASTPVGVATDTLIAKKNHPFLKYALQELTLANKWRVVPYATIMFGTGPMFLSTCLMNFQSQEQVYVIPNKVYTEEWFGNLHGGSWHSWDGVLIYWIYTHRLLGALIICSIPLIVFLLFRLVQSCRNTGTKAASSKDGNFSHINGHIMSMP